MELQHAADQKAFKEEYININCQLARIIRKPENNLTNATNMHKLFAVVLGICLVIITVLSFIEPDVCMAAVGGALFVLEFLYLNMIRSVADYRKKVDPNGDATLDEEGVELTKDHLRVKLLWTGMKCIRIYRYTIVFVPEKYGAVMIAVPIENKEYVLSFMREHNLNIRVIENNTKPAGSQTAE